MKKLLSLALVTLLIISLAVGCAPKSEPATNTDPTPTETEAAAFKDGTYTAKGDADERGWAPEITITVKDGKITEVKYDEVSGMKKSADTAYHKNFMDKNKVDLLAAYKTIQDSLVASQDVAKIDGYTGATHAADSFKALAAEALKDAKEGDKYKDGSYKAVGTADERGWTPQATITVAEGKITAAVYDEVSNKTFVNKSQDAGYISRFKEQKNVDIVAAYQALQSSLVAKQDPAQVDAYTGATHAYDSFVALAKKALEQIGRAHV